MLPAKKKIAVLGGGMGSMSAVFELTNYPAGKSIMILLFTKWAGDLVVSWQLAVDLMTELKNMAFTFSWVFTTTLFE